MKRRFPRILFLTICLLASPPAGVAAQDSADFFLGDLSHPTGSPDVNPCIENVVPSINRLGSSGETLGFNWGAHYLPVQGAGTKNHWQGIQRLWLPRLPVPYLFVSSSHRERVLRANGELDEISRPGHFAVVEMGSRENLGGRLRSNRLEFGKLTRDVAPPENDRIVVSQIVSREFDHPGGMQVIGKYLLLNSAGNIEHHRDVAEFMLWDLTNPLEPRQLWDSPKWELPPNNANSVGVVKLDDGRYLLLRALSDARILEFYILNSDLEDNPAGYLGTNGLWDRWHHSELQSELFNPDSTLDLAWGDVDNIVSGVGYQNTNLVTECETGKIFLIASHGRRPQGLGGGDYIDAYRVSVPRRRPDPDAGGDGVVITKVASKHIFPSANSGERQGDLQAAGGAYVSPSHKLFYYATEHGRSGPSGSVKMIEFSPQEPVSEVREIRDAGVELYAEESFEGRAIFLDYADRDLRNYDDFNEIENFDKAATSAIYAIPGGYKLRLYAEKNRQGGFLELVGTGAVERIPNLQNIFFSVPDTSLNRISSGEWLASEATSVMPTEDNLPSSFQLFQNYPNPFNPTTVINYRINDSGPVRHAIYDLKGRLIKTLVNQEQPRGFYSTKWNAKNETGDDVASGTYLYRIEMGDTTKARKLTLIR